jgi:hypothetical protein
MENKSDFIHVGVFFIFLFFFIGLFFIIIYPIHETGHILFGFLDGVISGKINHFEISNWVSHPIISFIKIPQQTRIITPPGSLNFMLGGPIFTILIFLALSLFGYLKSGEKKWFLLGLSIFLFEISGNIICGTDNFIGSPLSYCNKGIDLTLQWMSIFIFSGVFSYFIVKKCLQ